MDLEPSTQLDSAEGVAAATDGAVVVDPAPEVARSTFDVFVRDPLREAVEAQSDGRTTILYDAAGHPNHMHVLPRLTYADLGFERQLGAATSARSRSVVS